MSCSSILSSFPPVVVLLFQHQFLKKLAFLQQAGEHDTEAVVKTCILIYKPKVEWGEKEWGEGAEGGKEEEGREKKEEEREGEERKEEEGREEGKGRLENEFKRVKQIT